MIAKVINKNIKIAFSMNKQDRKDIYGTTLFRKNQVYINPSICLSEKQITIMHELIHYMERSNSYIDEMSELQVEHMAIEMLYFIRNNKRIINYLQM